MITKETITELEQQIKQVEQMFESHRLEAAELVKNAKRGTKRATQKANGEKTMALLDLKHSLERSLRAAEAALTPNHMDNLMDFLQDELIGSRKKVYCPKFIEASYTVVERVAC